MINNSNIGINSDGNYEINRKDSIKKDVSVSDILRKTIQEPSESSHIVKKIFGSSPLKDLQKKTTKSLIAIKKWSSDCYKQKMGELKDIDTHSCNTLTIMSISQSLQNKYNSLNMKDREAFDFFLDEEIAKSLENYKYVHFTDSDHLEKITPDIYEDVMLHLKEYLPCSEEDKVESLLNTLVDFSMDNTLQIAMFKK